MANVLFEIPSEKQNPNLHHYLASNAQRVGGCFCSFNHGSEIYVRTYELNDSAIIVKEDTSGRVFGGRIIGSLENVRKLTELLNLKDMVNA